MPVAVVTDSTSCLPVQMAQEAGVAVVSLHVTEAGTSQPSPGELAARYREAAEAVGAHEILSLHLSARMSGTVDAARAAGSAVASEGLRVHVLDSTVLGMAMGYAAISAAQRAQRGGDLEAVTQVAQERASAAATYFYVDSLEHLRRGGRIGSARSLLATALSIKPLLTIADGEVQPLERVRTRGKALARLEHRGREAAQTLHDAGRMVDVAVHHVGWPERAESVAGHLRGESPATRVDVVELDEVTAVHTGPLTLALTVSPRTAASD